MATLLPNGWEAMLLDSLVVWWAGCVKAWLLPGDWNPAGLGFTCDTRPTSQPVHRGRVRKRDGWRGKTRVLYFWWKGTDRFITRPPTTLTYKGTTLLFTSILSPSNRYLQRENTGQVISTTKYGKKKKKKRVRSPYVAATTSKTGCSSSGENGNCIISIHTWSSLTSCLAVNSAWLQSCTAVSALHFV